MRTCIITMHIRSIKHLTHTSRDTSTNTNFNTNTDTNTNTNTTNNPNTNTNLNTTNKCAFRDDDDAEALQNSFPEGEHPLEGIPNNRELSAPEGLKGKFRWEASTIFMNFTNYINFVNFSMWTALKNYAEVLNKITYYALQFN